jgi:hypothetical protein
VKAVRGVAAVIFGYALSQGINGLFVYFWYFGERSLGVAPLSTLTFFTFLAVGLGTGYLTARLGGTHGLSATRGVAALIVLVTVVNIVADVAAEPLWHKLIVLLVMAPAVVWAGVRTMKGAEALS